MNKNYILTYGFAIFAMFFGSGNLVFPIAVGYQSSGAWLAGFCGLFVTAVALPFLGLFAIKILKGNYINFFAQGGSLAKIILPFFTLSLLGSFAVVPRCIVVAYGGANFVSQDLSLLVFSLCFSIITYFACLKEKLIVSLIGKFMSPLMFVLLIGLIVAGMYQADPKTTDPELSRSFILGFTTGYQTMDLFAAFFFSSLIYKQIQSHLPSDITDSEALKYSIKPAILGSCLLGIVYFGLVFLGAHYQSAIDLKFPELMLPGISKYLLGDYAMIFIALAIICSCFTTAIALNNIYATYLCNLLQIQAMHFPKILFLTTCISFSISLLNFNGIASFLAPILEISYPGLIALTIISLIPKNIMRRLFDTQKLHYAQDRSSHKRTESNKIINTFQHSKCLNFINAAPRQLALKPEFFVFWGITILMIMRKLL
jgi:LIVCS family branched-chain amino acid:cation transporter